MKGNRIMKMKFKNSNIEFELLNGEYHRLQQESGERICYYLCVGLCGKNKILFHYIDATQEALDYIQTIMNNLIDTAADYLDSVLQTNDNILVHMTLYPGEPTGYEIYYDCDCDSNNISDIVSWMAEHNDFAAAEYNFTEIVDEHQKCIEA